MENFPHSVKAEATGTKGEDELIRKQDSLF